MPNDAFVKIEITRLVEFANDELGEKTLKDLKDLVQKGFLIANKRGRNVYYQVTEKIEELF